MLTPISESTIAPANDAETLLVPSQMTTAIQVIYTGRVSIGESDCIGARGEDLYPLQSKNKNTTRNEQLSHWSWIWTDVGIRPFLM